LLPGIKKWIVFQRSGALNPRVLVDCPNLEVHENCTRRDPALDLGTEPAERLVGRCAL
jgi:hypothetical protein